MKFIGTILALAVLQSTTAFVVQPLAGQTSALKSSPGYQYSTNTGVDVQSPQNGVSPGSEMTSGGSRAADEARSIWDQSTPIIVQGGSLRTWSFPAVERVQVLLRTEGRPLQANIDLWQGPDNTPQKMAVYIEDGDLRPFSAVIETPRGHNAIAIRNTGALEFPLAACVDADDNSGSARLVDVTQALSQNSRPETIQGGAIKTYSFAPTVSSVQVLLITDGRPLNARIELLQGPNNNKQVIEVYTEDGNARPFFATIETPGTGNVVRIINAAPVEFPMSARVEPYLVEAGHIQQDYQDERGGWDSGSSSFYLTGQGSRF
jgi:hypothetical protein